MDLPLFRPLSLCLEHEAVNNDFDLPLIKGESLVPARRRHCRERSGIKHRVAGVCVSMSVAGESCALQNTNARNSSLSFCVIKDAPLSSLVCNAQSQTRRTRL